MEFNVQDWQDIDIKLMGPNTNMFRADAAYAISKKEYDQEWWPQGSDNANNIFIVCFHVLMQYFLH
jgi:hypothetical protein